MSALGVRLFGGFSIVRLYRDLSRFFSTADKRQLYLVSIWASGVSALEALVAAAVIPYVGCLSNRCPVEIESTVNYLRWPLVPALSLSLFFLISLKLCVQGVFFWYSAHFNQRIQRNTLDRLLESYLHLDWSKFRSENRTHYLRRCTHTAIEASSASIHCLALLSSSFTLIFLATLMAWQYPLASIPLALGFLALNSLTQRVLGRKQKHSSIIREDALRHWNVGITETFASFREIRVFGLERFFLDRLETNVGMFAKANAMLNFYPVLPRLIIDFSVLGILLLTVSIWMLLKNPAGELLPQLIFYAVVARSILPAMMNILSARSALIAALYNVELVLQELEDAAIARIERIAVISSVSDAPAFCLEKVTFGHTPVLPLLLNGADLRVAHPSWLAIIGPSGAGKSTLMELLCGVHRPHKGRIVHYWPLPGAIGGPAVAYLPQNVALLDDTVMQNVVFGFDDGDPDRVDDALRIACLKDTVDALPRGRMEQAGADAIRLSGGQRQRLALARALYRYPDLLLLDEATSGLDEATEKMLFTSLRRERPRMTVVYITHRTNNLEFADRVVRIHNGKVEELAERSATHDFS